MVYVQPVKIAAAGIPIPAVPVKAGHKIHHKGSIKGTYGVPKGTYGLPPVNNYGVPPLLGNNYGAPGLSLPPAQPINNYNAPPSPGPIYTPQAPVYNNPIPSPSVYNNPIPTPPVYNNPAPLPSPNVYNNPPPVAPPARPYSPAQSVQQPAVVQHIHHHYNEESGSNYKKPQVIVTFLVENYLKN